MPELSQEELKRLLALAESAKEFNRDAAPANRSMWADVVANGLPRVVDEMSALRSRVQELERIAWALVRNAERTADFNHTGKPVWAFVREAAALGKTSSMKLCEEFGVDPHKLIPIRGAE